MISIENVDCDELGLFLVLTVNDQRLKELGIRRHCPSRKNKGPGRPPKITASGSDSRDEIRWSPWKRSKSIPGDDTIRKMFVEAINVSIKTTMKNHIFTFNQKLYEQSKGGAIGVGLTGEIYSWSIGTVN